MLQREMLLHSIENLELKNARLRSKMSYEGIDHSGVEKTPKTFSTTALKKMKENQSSSSDRDVSYCILYLFVFLSDKQIFEKFSPRHSDCREDMHHRQSVRWGGNFPHKPIILIQFQIFIV